MFCFKAKAFKRVAALDMVFNFLVSLKAGFFADSLFVCVNQRKGRNLMTEIENLMGLSCTSVI